jgi:DNA invertase Pin-like site-specific DNA recombinase
MGTAYFYLRESHPDSAASGISHETQVQLCERYYALHLEPQGIARGEMVYDSAISAYKVPFLLRPGGTKLDILVREGDHVVVAYHDRLHRTIKDFAILHDLWAARGVTLHFANLMCDLSTPQGMLMAQMMFCVAQAESANKSVRNRAVAAYLRNVGRQAGKCIRYGYKPATGIAPTGLRTKRLGRPAQLAPYEEERRLMKLCHMLRGRGFTLGRISQMIEELTEELRKQRPHEPTYRKGLWARERCYSAAKAWVAILDREGDKALAFPKSPEEAAQRAAATNNGNGTAP